MGKTEKRDPQLPGQPSLGASTGFDAVKPGSLPATELVEGVLDALNTEYRHRPELAADAVPMLVRALADKRAREGAVRAIGRIGPAANAAVPALIPLLKDDSWVVRLFAAKAIGKIGPGAGQAVPALIEFIRVRDDFILGLSQRVSAAAEALGKIGVQNDEVVAALSEALAIEDEDIRHYASEALERLGGVR
jgi:HEAT repeat protein